MQGRFVRRREVALYVEHAHRMLVVAARNLEDGFYESAVNRAYYAIFYAANAMLSTHGILADAEEGVTRRKHSGVISAFRERFVKTGVIEAEYSRAYGRAMDDRHLSDYEIYETITAEQSRANLDDAQSFVGRVEAYLREDGWL